MSWAIAIIAAYLIGSIPFGVLIGRVKGIDIREHGSRNIGATNVGRVLGRRLGLLCFALDVTKGAAPVLVAGVMTDVLGRRAAELSMSQMWLWLAVAAAAVIGHMYSLFLRFGGGKGVATGFGALVAMWPLLTLPALIALAVWYASLRIFKYVSLASMLAAASLPLTYLLMTVFAEVASGSSAPLVDHVLHASPPLILTVLIAALVVYRHRENIARIRRGEEPKATGNPRS